MITVNTNNTKYSKITLQFSHNRNDASYYRTPSGKRKLVRDAEPTTTSCTITFMNNDFVEEFIVTGHAVLHPNDNFNASIGREVALFNALTTVTLPNKIRNEILRAYFTR